MRQDIELYIGGQRCDCDTATLVQLNYTREELNTPAVVRNTYSQSVSLPGTAINNAIFGHIFRSDRITTPTAFNPLKRADFAIYKDGGNLLMKGYAKLTAIESAGGRVWSYKVQLYGGLGGFFTNLTSNEDGDRLTLASLRYWYNNAEDPAAFYPSTDIEWPADAAVVAGLWSSLAGGGNQLLTFVPTYGGVPDKNFDAGKALIFPGDWNNTPGSAVEGGKQYLPWEGIAKAVLVDIGQEVTEWEVQDLRAYLQRPALSIREFLRAVAYSGNNGGYKVVLDPSFFNENNPAYTDTYYTLPLLDREALAADERTPDEAILADYLAGSITPVALLLSYAKQYGLVFLYEDAANTVSILSRATFYGTGKDAIDLTEKIDRSSIRVTPTYAAARWYELANGEVYGEEAEKYKEQTGRTLGSYRIDTGWEFDRDTKNIMETIETRGAANVVETSPFFAYYYDSEAEQYAFKFGRTLSPQIQLWTADHAESIRIGLSSFKADIMHTYAQTAQYEDLFNKIQLHGKDNSPEDGAGVLVQFVQMVELPADDVDGTALEFRLSNDNGMMPVLNNGTPCWDCRRIGSPLASLPQFRWVEWPEVFADRWGAYLRDRYDVDSRVMRCRVDLRGLDEQVGQGLLRRFFFYDGAVWSLNKITNHSITTLDPTECEFVRVQDTDNYTNGQTI